MKTTYISGPISCHILQNNGVKYYLFGDVHTKPKINSCQDMYSLSCTSINKTFDDIVRKNSNCWSIAALLFNWIKVNNDNKINTDIYLEVPFSKINERQRIKPLTNIINKRREIKHNFQVLTDGQIIDDMDDIDDNVNQLWILTLELLFRDCLIPDKKLCPEYIHMHYVDTRLTDYNNLDINPFLVDDFMKSEYYDSILIYLYNHRHKIYDKIYMGNENLDSVINSFNLPSDPDFIQRFKDITRSRVVRNNKVLHRVASEYNRLKEIYPDVAYKLRNFVFEILDTFTEDDINEDAFKSIGSVEMDIYTISRMFIQQNLNSSFEIIIYAGANHITTYYTFLADVLGYKELYNSQHDHELDIKCVQIPSSLIDSKLL
jgi:hypothetical protein